jgi:hypothetical protein
VGTVASETELHDLSEYKVWGKNSVLNIVAMMHWLSEFKSHFLLIFYHKNILQLSLHLFHSMKFLPETCPRIMLTHFLLGRQIQVRLSQP